MTVAIPQLAVEPIAGQPSRAMTAAVKPASGAGSIKPDAGRSSFHDALKSAERDLAPEHAESSAGSIASNDAQPSREAAQPGHGGAQDRSTSVAERDAVADGADADSAAGSREFEPLDGELSASDPSAEGADTPGESAPNADTRMIVGHDSVKAPARVSETAPQDAGAPPRQTQSVGSERIGVEERSTASGPVRSAPATPELESPTGPATTGAARAETAPAPAKESPRGDSIEDVPVEAESGAPRTVEVLPKSARRGAAAEGVEATLTIDRDSPLHIEPKPQATVAAQPGSDSGPRTNAEPSASTNQAPSVGATVQASPSGGGSPSSGDDRRELGGRKQTSDSAKPMDAPVAADRSPVQALKLTTEPAQKLPASAQLSPGAAQPPTQASADEAVRANAAGIVSRGLAAVVQQRGGQMTVRLTPESLGQVKVQMSLDHGTVAVRLEASSEAARGLLSEHLGMLRGSLESRGLSVEKLSVHLAAPGAGAGSGPGSGPGGGSSSADGGAQERSAFGGQDGRHDAGGAPSRGRDGGEREPESGRSRVSFAGGEAQMERAEPTEFVSRLRLSLHAIA